MTPVKTDILDTLENGVIITDKDLKILSWNRWLVVHTGISQEKARGQHLPQLFPGTSFSILKRKIRIAFTLKKKIIAPDSSGQLGWGRRQIGFQLIIAPTRTACWLTTFAILMARRLANALN